MRRYRFLALLAFYFAFTICVLAESPDAGVFSEALLVDALQKGSSLIVAEILCVRNDGVMYYYNVRVVRPIVLGDLEEDDLSGPLELFAGASYGDALKTSSFYALFVTKDCPYYFSWTYRDSIKKMDVTDDKDVQALMEAANRAYGKTSIRKFRQGWQAVQKVDLPALPEEIVSLCEQFRTNPENRAEIGKKIFESDLGSRRDESNPQSSIISYLPPKISITREQILSLLGSPSLRSGWTYSWLCGQSAERGWVGRDVYVLSAVFSEDEKVVRLFYQQQKKSRWTKLQRCLNELYGLADQPEHILLRFQRALQRGDWPEVLSYCTEKIRKKAQEYDSEKRFFSEFMPVEKIAGLSDLPVRGYGSRGGKIQSISLEVQLDVAQAEWPVNWQWSLVKDNDCWLVDFKTLAVETLIKKELLRRELEHEDPEIRIAKFEQGIEFHLTPLSEEFAVGQPMLFRIQMKNKSDDPILYMATGPQSVVTNDPMIVIGPNGKTLDYVDTSYQIGVWPDVILPGETIDLVDTYDVTTQYGIVKPGRYKFQFKGWPHEKKPSNIVQINVKPGELSLADSIAKCLSAVLPGGWTLTRRPCQREPSAEKSLQSPICVHMVGRSRGKGADVDVFLVICPVGSETTLESGLADEMDLWGWCKWGTIYGRARNAEEPWPDYQEQISKALEIE
jgi:hypothetical protein